MHHENDLGHPSIFCSCAISWRLDTRGRQHEMLRLQEEGYFLHSRKAFFENTVENWRMNGLSF